MMTAGYSVTSSCRLCGGPFEHVAWGKSDGRSARASMRCSDCGQKHLMVAVLEIDDRPLIATERAELSRRRRGLTHG